MRAGGELLEAWGLEELAELVELAIESGDEISWLRVRVSTGKWAVLDDTRFGRLLELLAAAGAQKGE